MTLLETKAKLASLGYVGEPTPEILKQWGWEPSDPLAGVVIEGPTVSESELRDHLSMLHEEAQAARVPAAILDGIVKFGKQALKLGLTI
jgi:hypothetical protein